MHRRGTVALVVFAAVAAQAVTAMPLVTLTPAGGVLNLPGGSPIPLSTIGRGLRKKRVLFATFRVYTAQLLVGAADVSKFDKRPSHALESLEQVSAVVMHLTFLRSVNPQQLSDSLSAALAANGYSVRTNADLQAVSKAIASTGELPQGSVGILAAVRQDPATDLVLYQAPSGRISSITGHSGLKRALMSAWFGQPADGGLRILRDEILGVPAEP